MISALGVSEEQQQIEPVDSDNDDNANTTLQLECENLIGGLDVAFTLSSLSESTGSIHCCSSEAFLFFFLYSSF